MKCFQCGVGAEPAEAWLRNRINFCSPSCAVQWALDRPLDDPAWGKVKVGSTLTSCVISAAAQGDVGTMADGSMRLP